MASPSRFRQGVIALSRRSLLLGMGGLLCATKQRFTRTVVRNNTTETLEVSYKVGDGGEGGGRRKVLEPGEQVVLNQTETPGCFGGQVPLREDLEIATVIPEGTRREELSGDGTRIEWERAEIERIAVWDRKLKGWFLIVKQAPTQSRSVAPRGVPESRRRKSK